MIPTGALLFARYAYPPNALGLCGPDESGVLLEAAAAGEPDGDVPRLARGFEGAWPYLRLIADAAGIGDPLDRRVVEAYWVGNGLLDRVHRETFRRFLEDTVRRRLPRAWDAVAETVTMGGVPHHNFHVFAVYPWLGLLRLGNEVEPLRVLEGCRIRWGEVLHVAGERAVVRSRGLVWDGATLGLGPQRVESVVASDGGRALASEIRPGDCVSLHWDWICDRLHPAELGSLRRRTLQTLAVVNAAERPAPAAVLS